VVVRSFEEAAALGAAKIKGKIVVWNQPWLGYSYGSNFRVNGASEAAKYGAIASLVRSVTPFSLYTLHTGSMVYRDGLPRIPSAAITVEDAELLQRMQDRGQAFHLELQLGCYSEADLGLSHNILAELPGTELPEEIIVMGGHIDAWTRGAQDDGGNFIAAWEAVNILARLNVRPRRTIRVVGWTSEEWGAYSEIKGQAGAWGYFLEHLPELNNTVFAMEADSGLFLPIGLNFQGSWASTQVLQDLSTLLEPYLTLQVVNTGGTAADIAPLCNAGVPGAAVKVSEDGRDGQYWWYVFSVLFPTLSLAIFFWYSRQQQQHQKPCGI
jgi:carboxypeptidase Q